MIICVFSVLVCVVNEYRVPLARKSLVESQVRELQRKPTAATTALLETLNERTHYIHSQSLMPESTKFGKSPTGFSSASLHPESRFFQGSYFSFLDVQSCNLIHFFKLLLEYCLSVNGDFFQKETKIT